MLWLVRLDYLIVLLRCVFQVWSHGIVRTLNFWQAKVKVVRKLLTYLFGSL